MRDQSEQLATQRKITSDAQVANINESIIRLSKKKKVQRTEKESEAKEVKQKNMDYFDYEL